MDPLITLAIFCSYSAIDGLHAVYTIAVVSKSRGKAASLSAIMYLLIAAGTISYVDNWMYVFPMAAGGFAGTFISLWIMETYEKKTSSQTKT